MTSPSSPCAIAIDTGGTFTDVVLLDRMRGTLWNAKVSSTPTDPSDAFMTGIEQALQVAGLRRHDLGHIFHGTTVATNLILEHKGANAALLTTAGFRHVLEIGRHDIPRHANMYSWIKPKRPVPPDRIYEIPGRIEPDGGELAPLDESAVRGAARMIDGAGILSIAICFLHSYANPAHERRAAEIVREEIPGAHVSISSDVLPVFREYERSMATILNVYVMPAVTTYVARLEERLHTSALNGPLLLMKSGGGLSSAQAVHREPIQTALSGPAAGVMGAIFIAEHAGFKNIITIDIGGTSADISLVKNGVPTVTSEGRVGEWPLHTPMIDIHTIGAGGGSIARVSDVGTLTVGPESAGAIPGPVCYNCGGVEPTVTDANLVLGRLMPSLLGGSLSLDRGAAERAIEEKIARPLGLDLATAARGMLSIVDNNMVGAIRVVSVERGHDPREFALLPFGGAGPLHGVFLARLLGTKVILVPPAPGVLSALGLLVSGLRADFSRTALQRPPDYDLPATARVLSELTNEARDWLRRESIPESGRIIEWHASLRYLHQGFELMVPWPGNSVTDASVEALVARFHDQHEQLYGFAQKDTPVEIVTLHATAIGSLPRPALRELSKVGAVEDAIIGRQIVDFDGTHESCALIDRGRLGAGATIRGPAVIAQLDSTVLLFPNQIAEVHRFGTLIVQAV